MPTTSKGCWPRHSGSRHATVDSVLHPTNDAIPPPSSAVPVWSPVAFLGLVGARILVHVARTRAASAPSLSRPDPKQSQGWRPRTVWSRGGHPWFPDTDHSDPVTRMCCRRCFRGIWRDKDGCRFRSAVWRSRRFGIRLRPSPPLPTGGRGCDQYLIGSTTTPRRSFAES